MYIVEGTLPDQLLGSVAKHPLDRGALVAYGAVGLQDGDDVRTVLDEGPESFLVLPQRLFGALAFRYVRKDPLPVQGVALSVSHQHRLVANPDNVAIAPHLAELYRERLPRQVRAPILLQDPLPIVGVDGAYPEVGIFLVRILWVAEHGFDLRAVVDRGHAAVHLFDVDDCRYVLDQGAVSLLGLPEHVLHPPEFRHVVDDALHGDHVASRAVDPLAELFDVPEHPVPPTY